MDSKYLKKSDSVIFNLIEEEEHRQEYNIELIAENFTPCSHGSHGFKAPTNTRVILEKDTAAARSSRQD